MSEHKHKHKVERWAVGQYPVDGYCACGAALMANGGGWVEPLDSTRVESQTTNKEKQR